MKRVRQAGVTLIELMIVIAVLGILVMVAYPAYQNHLKEVRRNNAQGELVKLQLAMEAFRVKNTSYPANLGALTGYSVGDAGTYYTFSVSGAVSTYTLTAAAKSGTTQAADTGCTSMGLNHNDAKTPTGCWKK